MDLSRYSANLLESRPLIRVDSRLINGKKLHLHALQAQSSGLRQEELDDFSTNPHTSIGRHYGQTELTVESCLIIMAPSYSAVSNYPPVCLCHYTDQVSVFNPNHLIRNPIGLFESSDLPFKTSEDFWRPA